MTAPTFFTLTGSWVPDTNKGYISGTASIQMLVGAGGVLPTSFGGTIVPHLIPAQVVNGVLCDQTGRPGVSLIANTPALNLSTSLYYEVVFSLTYHPAAGLPQSIKINPVTFTAPTSATTIDLGSVTPAAGVEAAQIPSVGSANITDATTIGRQILTAANAAAALAALGAAAVPSAGLVKSTGTALTQAVSGTDYAPPTTGNSLLKGNSAGGFASATSGTDYAPPTTGSGLLKGNGSGGFTAAVSGTDYGTYSKPGSGIPSSDMASAVQTSLGLANTALQPSAVADNTDGTLTANGFRVLEPLSTVTIATTSAAPVIGRTTYYNATSGNLTPILPALSGLSAGARLSVRRDPADTSTNTITLSCAGSDTFYSSGGTTATFPISGEQREYQVISISGTKYWAPQGPLNSISGLDKRYVGWSGATTGANGTAGILPATSGQKLTTQGGNTLDDGSGNTILRSITNPTGGTPLSTTQKPFLNQVGFFYGSITSVSAANYLGFTDEVVAGNLGVFGLDVEQSVVTPATGLRQAIKGHVNVISAGSNTLAQAQYIGVGGRAETSTNLGGTDLTATGSIGSFWGNWSFGVLNSGATFMANVFGQEVDITVASGASVREKKGILIALSANDAVRGSNDDIALNIANQGTVTNTWKNGIMFGDNQAAGTATPMGGTWPFASDSTIIGVSTPGTAGNPANIGIDFSTVTFTDCAIKTGPAPIQMGAMASAPATPASGKGKLYIASDGSLHYLGASGTDTRLAVA